MVKTTNGVTVDPPVGKLTVEEHCPPGEWVWGPRLQVLRICEEKHFLREKIPQRCLLPFRGSNVELWRLET